MGALLLALLFVLLSVYPSSFLSASAVALPAPGVKGYLDAVADCGADDTGTMDSTAALHGCFRAAYRYGGSVMQPLWPSPVFFPLGTYLVSDTLNLTQVNPGSDDGVNVCPARFLSLAAFGSSAVPGRRPILRLSPSSPGFSQATGYKAVVHIWCSSGEGVDMNNVWRGIDLDLTAEGNPSAVGIEQAGAQGAVVTDVKVTALSTTFACFAGLNGAGGEHSNIECESARYGVYLDNSQPVPVLAGGTFINQSVSAIRYLSQESLSLVAISITTSPTATGPSITSTGGDRGMSIVDTTVDCTGPDQVAIETPVSLYLRDVYMRGCGMAIAQATTAPLPGPNPADNWLHVQEWARGTDTGRFFLSDVMYVDNERTVNASVRSVTQLPKGSGPPPDLQSRHVWNSSEQANVDSPGVANAKSTCDARGDDSTDDTMALQTCLDQHAAVFLPPGRYRISATLNVPAGHSFIGMGSSFSFLLAATAGLSGASPKSPAPLLRTAMDDAVGQPTTVAFLGLLTWQHLADVYTVDWRTHHPLSLWRSNFDTRECECLWTSAYQRHDPTDIPCSLPHNLTIPKAVFRGLGRVHGFVNDDLGNILSTGAKSRAIRIADTAAFAGPEQRTRFYSLNLEHAQSESNAEIANVTWLDIYSVKVEGNMPILWLRGDVSHVSLLCLGGGFTAWPLNYSYPSDFTPAIPSAIRVDAGARMVTLAMLQDHGRAQSEYWPPTGGDCKWMHVYPFPGEAVQLYPYWTYPNVTMWLCWYGLTVSDMYWTMIVGPQGAIQPGDRPILWRLTTTAGGIAEQ
jgi:hypothetical protein